MILILVLVIVGIFSQCNSEGTHHDCGSPAEHQSFAQVADTVVYVSPAQALFKRQVETEGDTVVSFVLILEIAPNKVEAIQIVGEHAAVDALYSEMNYRSATDLIIVWNDDYEYPLKYIRHVLLTYDPKYHGDTIEYTYPPRQIWPTLEPQQRTEETKKPSDTRRVFVCGKCVLKKSFSRTW